MSPLPLLRGASAISTFSQNLPPVPLENCQNWIELKILGENHRVAHFYLKDQAEKLTIPGLNKTQGFKVCSCV